MTSFLRPHPIWLYRLLWVCLSPIVVLWLWRRRKRGKEHATRFAERLGQPARHRPKGQLIWFHGASVGESLSILPLINHLLTTQQDLHILVTTGTLTSAKLMEKRLPERAFHQFVPLDAWPFVRSFMAHWQPDISVFTESELWPELLYQAPNPMLINARLSPKSFRRYRALGWFFHPLIARFIHVFAQHEPDAERYAALGAPHTNTLPNLKFDAPPLTAAHADIKRWEKALAGRRVLLAASTHAGEEAQIANLHQQLSTHIPNLLTIIVPRHPERGTAIINQLTETGLTLHRRGLGEKPIHTGDGRTEIYIADTLGELGLFYQLADVVIIGGSLIPHGGHNPIEPLKLGCVTLCGPHMFNFMDMLPTLLNQQVLAQAKDLDDLGQMAQAYLMDHRQRATQQTHIQAVMGTLSGASTHLANLILTKLAA